MRPSQFRTLVTTALSIGVAVLAIIQVDRSSAQQAPPANPLPTGPLETRESLAAFQLPPGYAIELIACEPQVIDPVAIRFDERGRMWVVEMRDYPHGPKPGKPPTSVIKILRDRDGDGFFETSQVFAEQLLFANGVQPWRTGVIATVGGRVVYMPDDDDDGRADRVETWYQGFAQENSQLRANHPTLSIDNRIYVANGLRGGKVVDARSKEAKPVSISGMDFRFDPLRGDYEAVSGVGQFGLTFDDDGRRFVCSNRNPLKHIVLPNYYLRRNPSAPAGQVANDVAAAGAESRLYPLSRAWTTSTLHANQFTAACGVTIYSGDLIPALRDNGLTCDPTGNLVHREIMTAKGGTFVSKPARDGAEFLASPDEWFRPVNMANGPDGALYVVDMYRAVIEHPQFVPDELKNRPDQRYGEDRGRIYRIVPMTLKKRQPSLLAGLSDAALASRLNDANGWTRETAARLLLQKQDDALVPLLERQCTESTPRGWARSLWLLESLEKLDDAQLARALASKSPRVQLQALRLAEGRGDGEVRSAMRRLAQSNDSLVRYQLALSLTPAKPADIGALTTVALRGADDSWTRQAIALSAGSHVEAVTVNVLSQVAKSPKADSSSVALAAHLVELSARTSPLSKPLRRAVQNITPQDAAEPLLHALIRGAARGRVSFGKIKGEDAAFARSASRVLERSQAVAVDQNAATARRIDAIRLLGATAPFEAESLATLERLAESAERQETRIAAINALFGHAGDELSARLLDSFPAESPAVRRVILDLALARSSRIALLLDRIDSGQVKIGEIDRIRTNRLLKIGTPELKKRIAAAFADAIPQDRKKVLADYQTVLKLKSDPMRGELIFRKNCASCHRVGKWGVDVAPDIADSRTRKRAQLLTDILQPNRAIDSNYISYSVITADGRSMTGVLDVETSDSITLKLAEGKRVTLARADIDEMRSNGVSLMPEGLEKNINRQQMADLISYIKNWRYLDGLTPYQE